MSGQIRPALTAEEWAAQLDPEKRGPVSYHELVEWDGHEHQIAAVALHEQPFGFTREDAEKHREEARWERECAEQDPTNPCAKGPEWADWHDSMADRIEAMLPPEEAEAR